MALSQEQQNKVDHLFEKFKDQIIGELQQNFTTSNVKSLIDKYVQKADGLYIRNELNGEMRKSLAGKLFQLTKELYPKAEQREKENIDNPLEENQFISKDKFEEKLKQWLKGYKINLDKKRKEGMVEEGNEETKQNFNIEPFTHSLLVNYMNDCLQKGEHPFEEYKELKDKHALSNEMIQIVEENVKEITKTYLPYVQKPREANSFTNGTDNGKRVAEQFKKEIKNILDDMVDKAENTRDNLQKVIKEYLEKTTKLYKEESINNVDEKEIKNMINTIYEEYAKKFSGESHRRAQVEKVYYALNENEYIKEKDFKNKDNDLETSGIFYFTKNIGRIKKGAYKPEEFFSLIKKYFIEDFELSEFKNDKLKALKNKIEKMDKFEKGIIDIPKTKYQIDLKANDVRRLKNDDFNNLGMYYKTKKGELFYNNKDKCAKDYISNSLKEGNELFKLYKSKNALLTGLGIREDTSKTEKVNLQNETKPEEVESQNTPKEVESHDSLVHLKFKFEDGTIIECLDSENKSRDEVLAEAKKVYAQMKRSR